MNAKEMNALANKSVDRDLLNKAIAACESDINAMASRGYKSLERNAYSCYIGREDRGILDSLVDHLRKNGFVVINHQCSYWVGAIDISWRN